MRSLLIALVFGTLSCCAIFGDVGRWQRRQFQDQAQLTHHLHSVTVHADDPRPLAQAITAVSEEYGWVVDFEDPPYYADQDLVDDTDAGWRAKHPGAQGVRIVAGGAFDSEYPEGPETYTSKSAEAQVLNKIVEDYNLSKNPGKFALREQTDGSYTIVGTHVRDNSGGQREVSEILDIPISLTNANRNAYETIALILDALTKQSGTSVVPATMARNALVQTSVAVGGEHIPARTLLLRTIAATRWKMMWRLFYDGDAKTYYFNLVPAQRALYGTFGNRMTVMLRQTQGN